MKSRLRSLTTKKSQKMKNLGKFAYTNPYSTYALLKTILALIWLILKPLVSLVSGVKPQQRVNHQMQMSNWVKVKLDRRRGMKRSNRHRERQKWLLNSELELKLRLILRPYCMFQKDVFQRKRYVVCYLSPTHSHTQGPWTGVPTSSKVP